MPSMPRASEDIQVSGWHHLRSAIKAVTWGDELSAGAKLALRGLVAAAPEGLRLHPASRGRCAAPLGEEL
jgi:hypothetical protein